MLLPVFRFLPFQSKFKSFYCSLLHSLSHDSPVPISTDISTLLQGRIPRCHLLQIHAKIFRCHADQNNLIATRLIGHYSSNIALRIFNQLQNPNLFPFNAVIRVLAQEGNFSDSFSIFLKLKRQSLWPNDLTFSFILKACFRAKSVFYVKQIHTQILKFGFVSDPFVCNGLLSVYGKGIKDLISARKLFEEMPGKGAVSCWTSLIAGLALAGDYEEVLRFFCMLVKENTRPETDTLVSVLSACSNLRIDQVEKWVASLSLFIDNVDVEISSRDSVNTALVHLYGKLGVVEKSRERFDTISDNGKRCVPSWNSMINAYVQNGFPLEALNLFRLMVKDASRRTNHVTMVSVLSACSQIGDLELGSWVHDYMKCNGRRDILKSNTFLATALIDMYAKCGSLDNAKEVFDQMVSKDVISFNAMIMGLAVNGEGLGAVKLFSKMQECGLHPNAGTFLGLLWACSHSCLLDKGQKIFLEMSSRFFILPKLEHYACYVDLLAREGHVEEAISVTVSMPYKPNNFVWGALLSGCLLHHRVDLAHNIYKMLVEVDPGNSAGYVMFANISAVDHQWDNVSALRWFMREKGVKKQPGHSWISIDGIVQEFHAGFSHPHIESISCTLHGLVKEMKVATA